MALVSCVRVTSRRPYPFASSPLSLVAHLTTFLSPDPHHASPAPRHHSPLSLALLLLDSLLSGFSFFFTGHCRQALIPFPLSLVNQGRTVVTTSLHEEGFFLLLQSILVGVRRRRRSLALKRRRRTPHPHILTASILSCCLCAFSLSRAQGRGRHGGPSATVAGLG
jgi:hypothetical protein